MMGKSGDALRAKKAQTVYTFTREQLASRDKAVIEDYKRRYNDILHKELQNERRKIYEEAEQMWIKDKNDLFFVAMQYFCSMGCKVLVEEFNFSVSNRKDSKLGRFVDAVTKEVVKLSEQGVDVNEYRETVFRDYGIKFNWDEEKNAED